VIDLAHPERISQCGRDRADIGGRQTEGRCRRRTDVVVLRLVLLRALGSAEEKRTVPGNRSADGSTEELSIKLRFGHTALERQGILGVQLRVANVPGSRSAQHV
jgi:hypothetical protein